MSAAKTKLRAYGPIVWFLGLMPAALVGPALAHDAHHQEQQLKAAFVYNFIKFVEWPNERTADNDRPITIGIVGSQDSCGAFAPVKHKKIKNRDISIQYIAGYEQLTKPSDSNDQQWQQKIAALKTCDVLLLLKCSDARRGDSTEIIKALRDSWVLTVGETTGFLESGGMINFLMEGRKVRFEINYVAAKQAKLQIRSQLLRLAERVISEPSTRAKH